jgi:adenine deaminase
MFVAIREGSAARNFDALAPLLRERPEMCFLCSDDKHPDELLTGHINTLVSRAIAAGAKPLDALRAATLNPVRHYGLDIGLLQSGDPADFAVLTSLEEGRVLETRSRGKQVAKNGVCTAASPAPLDARDCPNKFERTPVTAAELRIARDERAATSGQQTAANTAATIRVIGALDGQLLTEELLAPALVRDGQYVADPARDILKIAVVNRYLPDAPPALGFIKNFGLRANTALASSVAHDSHNIVAVGADDTALAAAINAVIAHKGGLSFADTANAQTEALPLPVAGLMSNEECPEAAAKFARLSALAHAAGCTLRSPYMTLSFMALLVIPNLKLGDRGLFSVNQFAFTPLAV